MTYQSLIPTTGKLIIKFDEITDQQLEDILTTAATFFETWKHKTCAQRGSS